MYTVYYICFAYDVVNHLGRSWNFIIITTIITIIIITIINIYIALILEL